MSNKKEYAPPTVFGEGYDLDLSIERTEVEILRKVGEVSYFSDKEQEMFLSDNSNNKMPEHIVSQLWHMPACATHGKDLKPYHPRTVGEALDIFQYEDQFSWEHMFCGLPRNLPLPVVVQPMPCKFYSPLSALTETNGVATIRNPNDLIRVNPKNLVKYFGYNKQQAQAFIRTKYYTDLCKGALVQKQHFIKHKCEMLLYPHFPLNTVRATVIDEDTFSIGINPWMLRPNKEFSSTFYVVRTVDSEYNHSLQWKLPGYNQREVQLLFGTLTPYKELANKWLEKQGMRPLNEYSHSIQKKILVNTIRHNNGYHEKWDVKLKMLNGHLSYEMLFEAIHRAIIRTFPLLADEARRQMDSKNI